MAVPVTDKSGKSGKSGKFDKFDSIYILSCPMYLKGRVPKVIYQLKALGFDSVPVHTVITPKSELIMNVMSEKTGCRDYAVYCAFGHLTAMNDMVCRGYKRSLLLEDDIRFMKDADSVRKYLSRLPEDFDVARLAWVYKRGNAWRCGDIYARGNWGQHAWCQSYDAGAYIVSEKGATLLLQKYNECVTQSCSDKSGHFEIADWVFIPSHTEEFHFNHYVSVPMLARQASGQGCSPYAVVDRRYRRFISKELGSTLEDYVWDFSKMEKKEEPSEPAEPVELAKVDAVVLIVDSTDTRPQDQIDKALDSCGLEGVQRFVATNPDSKMVEDMVMRLSDGNPDDAKATVSGDDARRAFGHYLAHNNAVDLSFASTEPFKRVLFAEWGAGEKAVKEALSGDGKVVSSKDKAKGCLAYSMSMEAVELSIGRQDMFSTEIPEEDRLPFLAIGDLLGSFNAD